MRGKLIVLTLALASIALGFMPNLVFAEESISWKSTYRVGILNYENDSEIPIKVTTYSKNSLKIEWNKPKIESNEILIGYEIQRKSLNSDYRTIADNFSSKSTFYIDKSLDEGYYAYNVAPIIENQKADEITMHGIDRKSNLFSIYMKGQELIAENILEQNCINCFDPEFEEIDNTFRYEFSEFDKRLEFDFQEKVTFEITKASEFFSNLFDVRSNH